MAQIELDLGADNAKNDIKINVRLAIGDGGNIDCIEVGRIKDIRGCNCLEQK